MLLNLFNNFIMLFVFLFKINSLNQLSFFLFFIFNITDTLAVQ
jgi:hypothetical protein